MRRVAGIALVLALGLGCGEATSPMGEVPGDPAPDPDPPANPPAPGPPRAGDPPTSDRLTAVVSLGFGDAPVEGLVYLLPGTDGAGSTYTVDLDGDGTSDREGRLERGIGFGYRFEEPGVHRIRVRFERPDGEVLLVEPPVVVNDPSALRTLAEVQVPPSIPDSRSFEGIAVDPAGRHVYVGDYRAGSLVQLDPGDLSVVRRIDTMGQSIEGLAVSPGGDRLFAVYKYGNLASVALPEMELEVRHGRLPFGAFFIHPIEGPLVLTSGRAPFTLVDPLTGTMRAQATLESGESLWSWQFAVSDDGATAVVVSDVRDASDRVYLVDVPSLAVRREIVLPRLSYARLVALDPGEPRAYVLGNDPDQARFLVVDLETGAVVRDVALGPSHCSGYCVANPVAVGSGGRWIAMEWYGGAYLIDTELDLPRFRIGNYGFSLVGFSVAASPTEPGVFYFLDSGGGLRKVRAP